MDTLTARQKAIFDFIVEFRREHGCSPSIPELQEAFSIKSPNGVVGHILALESKGFIRRSKRGSRQIDLVERETTIPLPVSLPVFPKPPPASNHLASLPPHRTLTVDAETLGFVPPAGSYAIRVRTDSLRNAGIHKADIAIIEPSKTPQRDRVVLATVDGELLLLRYLLLNGCWFLRADNPDYPELYPLFEVLIHGVVRTIIRTLA